MSLSNLNQNPNYDYAWVKKNAAEVQDACNPIAVANFLVNACKVVSDEKGGFDAMRNDPYLQAVIGKLCDMFHVEHNGRVYDIFTMSY